MPDSPGDFDRCESVVISSWLPDQTLLGRRDGFP